MRGGDVRTEGLLSYVSCERRVPPDPRCGAFCRSSMRRCAISYDVADFVAALRALNITPHLAQNTSGRRSAIDRRTTRRPRFEEKYLQHALQ
jgi:hypothetical protein